MRQHALLSASGAARWLACTPSARFEEGFPESTSPYAEEGTLAHSVAELMANYYIGRSGADECEEKLMGYEREKYYNTELREATTAYGKLIREKHLEALQRSPDTQVELEVRVDFSDWVPEGFGTCDCLIISDGVLEIIDFKYGKGVRVDAENNPQMLLYALGAVALYESLYDFETVRTTIFQPRISEEPSTSEMSLNTLLAWGNEYVRPRALLADAGGGDYAPSDDTCRWCRGKEQCRARTEKNLALFDEAPDVNLLTPDEAAVILGKAKDIKAWLSDIESLVQKTLLDGIPVTGWKLVEGRSNRRYTDELLVAKALKKAGYKEAIFYEKKLLTITALEKALGKKEVGEVLGELIEKPEGAPTVAPITDKRQEFKPQEAVLAAFDEGGVSGGC